MWLFAAAVWASIALSLSGYFENVSVMEREPFVDGIRRGEIINSQPLMRNPELADLI
jgi:hypothetical protein